jgi:hypothetical protein
MNANNNEHKHFHTDERGVLVACYHQCKNWGNQILGAWQFWLGVTVSFPIEHFIWEKVWPFKLFTEFLLGH